MKFKHTETQEDGGGSIAVISESKVETLEIIKHFKPFETDTPEGVIKMAEALQTEGYTYESTPKKRFWYAVESALDYDSTKPYTDLLEKITGYKTFKRSCRNWREFAQARKITVETGLTYDQAADRCRVFNAQLTPAQVRKGTKLEFTAQ